MTHSIFAWTGPTTLDGYPPFVNISRDEQGNHTITVRGSGDGSRQIACATIPVEALESLLGDLAADLYRDDAPGVAAAPAPLTDEQAMRIVINACDSLNITRVHELGGKTRTICDEAGLLEIVRAVEAAHGIAGVTPCRAERRGLDSWSCDCFHMRPDCKPNLPDGVEGTR
jgi:hypothetical protein